MLAEDVTAAVALPSFDNSSMDGYAVLAADVAGASREAPATLPVTGEIAAGDIGAYRLVPGTAIKIMTGAQLPVGRRRRRARRVDRRRHRPRSDLPAGAAGQRGPVRRRRRGRGRDAASAGTRLRPMQIAVAASAGRKAVLSGRGPGSWCCPPGTS